jgi:hypothetical protein
MMTSKFGLIAAGAYLAIAFALYALAYTHPSGLGYEFIPLLRWAFPWSLIFNSDALSILVGIPLNMLLVYCLSWLCARLLRKSQR